MLAKLTDLRFLQYQNLSGVNLGLKFALIVKNSIYMIYTLNNQVTINWLVNKMLTRRKGYCQRHNEI